MDDLSREAEVPPAGTVCPHCGAPLRGRDSANGRGHGSAMPAVVDGTAARGPARASGGLIAVRPMFPTLSAVIWRPAVRAAAEAGIGTLALTVGARLLRAWLARPPRLQVGAIPALPAPDAPLGQPAFARPPRGTMERGVAVVETVVYLRRVVRPR